MAIEASEKENINRWNLSKEGGFFESYIVHWVDPAQEIAAVFRYNLLSPKEREPEATVWGHFFNRKEPKQNLALKETLPVTSCQVEHELFYFSIGPSGIFQSGARGDLKSSMMSWELKFLPPIRSFRHLPTPFYHLRIPAIKWLAPQLTAQLSGELKVRDKNFSFSSAIVSQVHLWGNGLDENWVRGHCHHFKEEPEALFEGVSVPVTVKGKTLNVPLLYIVYRGNTYIVRDPVAWMKCKSNYSANQWHFEVQQEGLLFIGDFSCASDSVASFPYEDPDGSMRQIQSTPLADLKIQIYRKETKDWKPVETLTAEKTAFFESGFRKA